MYVIDNLDEIHNFYMSKIYIFCVLMAMVLLGLISYFFIFLKRMKRRVIRLE
jgi:hypothetical protein